MEEEAIAARLAEYRGTIAQWGEEMERIGERGAARRANALFDRTHAHFKVLRDSQEGRNGIALLMRDPNPYVAAIAAGHSLLWAPEQATQTLEALQSSPDAPGPVRIDAEYTLKEWRAGSLYFDW